MDSIDLIAENLRRSEEIVLARIEDMREHALVVPTPRGGGTTLWVLGHLAFIEALVVQSFMLGRRNPLAEWEEVFDGEEAPTDPAYYPDFDMVLSRCHEVREETLRIVSSLTEGDLDRESEAVPDGADELFGTYRRCLQYAADHWYMHRGQLADARRAAGLQRSWF